MSELTVEVSYHLRQLEQQPDTPVNSRLLQDAAHLIPQQVNKADPALISLLAFTVLKPIPDVQPAIELLTVLLRPFSYDEILDIAHTIDFKAGLAVDAGPFNHLTLAILEKASDSATHVEDVVRQPGVIAAIVRLWLSTSDTSVAEKCGHLLLKMLQEDVLINGQTSRLGAWRAIYGDPEVTDCLSSLPNDRPSEHLSIDKSQRTLAQARVLDWLPKVAALDWQTIANRNLHVNDSEDTTTAQTLLEFASRGLVDQKDVLMHRCLLEFYTALLKVQTAPRTLPLDYLKAQGFHSKIIAYYISPKSTAIDPLDLTFLLYAPAADYIATYAYVHPSLYRSDPICAEISARLNAVLSRPQPADLHLLASLPRQSLLPAPGTPWSTSPVSRLSTRTQSPDTLNTLATLFSSVESDEVRYPALSPLEDKLDPEAEQQRAAAPRLLELYAAHNASFERDIEVAAATHAIPELAAAAKGLIRVVKHLRSGADGIVL